MSRLNQRQRKTAVVGGLIVLAIVVVVMFGTGKRNPGDDNNTSSTSVTDVPVQFTYCDVAAIFPLDVLLQQSIDRPQDAKDLLDQVVSPDAPPELQGYQVVVAEGVQAVIDGQTPAPEAFTAALNAVAFVKVHCGSADSTGTSSPSPTSG